MKERELWLDYLRAFACILVSLGHLFMSFQDTAVVAVDMFRLVIKVLYHFHVYIFFFCSGYLLQKSFQKNSNPKLFIKNKILRCADFLIVYIIFSGITYVINTVLSGDVNSPVEHSFIETLLKYPINQMWYMYAICIITLCTPMIVSERAWKIQLGIALMLKVVICIPQCSAFIPVPLNYLFDNQIWYVLGVLWAFKGFTPKKWLVALATLFFLTGSILDYFCNIDNTFFNALLTLTGVFASAGFFYLCKSNHERIHFVWKMIAKYMLQIYLLHTIFAAGIRIVLLRLGIVSMWVHLPLGILFSIAVPIFAAMICDKVKILNVVFYPSKTIKSILKKQ